ncbi:MAG: hypothetical protein ACRCW2_03080 [Cellulosilyticaceae bacterium]
MKKLGVLILIGLVALGGCTQKAESVVIPTGPVVVEEFTLTQEEAEEEAKDAVVRLLRAYEDLDKQGIVESDLRIVGASEAQFDAVVANLAQMNNYILHNVQVTEVKSNEIKGVFGYEYDYTDEAGKESHYQSVAYFSVVKVADGYKLMGSEALSTDQASMDAFFAEGKTRWGTENLLEK